jgi:hypothetical protein
MKITSLTPIHLCNHTEICKSLYGLVLAWPRWKTPGGKGWYWINRVGTRYEPIGGPQKPTLISWSIDLLVFEAGAWFPLTCSGLRLAPSFAAEVIRASCLDAQLLVGRGAWLRHLCKAWREGPCDYCTSKPAKYLHAVCRYPKRPIEENDPPYVSD